MPYLSCMARTRLSLTILFVSFLSFSCTALGHILPSSKSVSTPVRTSFLYEVVQETNQCPVVGQTTAARTENNLNADEPGNMARLLTT